MDRPACNGQADDGPYGQKEQQRAQLPLGEAEFGLDVGNSGGPGGKAEADEKKHRSDGHTAFGKIIHEVVG